MPSLIRVQEAECSTSPIPVKRKKKRKPIEFLCLAIACLPLLGYIIFNAFPVLISFVGMFVEMESNDITSMQWNNFQNFVEVFKDPVFWKSWGITFWLASAQLITLTIALIISVLLEQKIKGSKAFQVLFFIPYICSSVAIAVMWSWIFDKNGIINSIFRTSVNWLNNNDNPYTLTWAVFITILWQAPSYGIVMFKAALKNVNPSLYEAASIDGANGFQKFWLVTFPGIKAVTLFLLLAGITTGLATFDAVTVLAPIQWTGVAGPDNAGLTISYYIYVTGVQNFDMPNASVMSWCLFIVNFLLSFFVIRARNKASAEA